MITPLLTKKLSLPERGRIICISDVHANLAYLKGLLAKLSLRDEDTLVFVGDIMEKGPDSVRRRNGSRARVVSRRAIRPVRRVRFGTGGRRTADDGGTASGLRTTAPPSETSSRGV